MLRELYFVRVWDAVAASPVWERRTTAASIHSTVDDAEEWIRRVARPTFPERDLHVRVARARAGERG